MPGESEGDDYYDSMSLHAGIEAFRHGKPREPPPQELNKKIWLEGWDTAQHLAQREQQDS